MPSKNTPKKIVKSRPASAASTPFYRRKLFVWPVGVVLGLAVFTFLAFKLSPWPSVLLVRMTFDHSGREARAAQEKHTPSTPVTVISDQQYQEGNRHALLDVYMPKSVDGTNQTLPVVVWTHGGAWVSGSKIDNAAYFKLLASQSFTVVALNYTLAPTKKYPAQLFELNEALSYIVANADRFHINPTKIFLAGDSAGSQLSSQMAALITNPAYAQTVGIKPALVPDQLAGTVLFCGIYKVEGLTEADPHLPKLISWGDDQVVWAFSGTRDYSSPIIHQMSPYYFVTEAFPPTFISGGNGDPLTDKQSVPLANKLKSAGAGVTTLFYAADHQPALPHEYQFNLDTADGRKAFAELTQFLRSQAQAQAHQPDTFL
jgi:acetyl esterase/lipase